ncbi:hypothetical protein [Modestobacter sp. NPDC049651]|uniref:hypothetical protein n=1 Tax=unclassified Modestobacter TaxID=2643866 RepID=UPI0033E3551C
MTTPAQDVATATPRSRRRIVGYNPSLSVFAACALIGVFVFSWGFLASPPNDASNLLNVLPAMCLVATVMCLLGTCRLVVDPAGFIDVINLLLLRRVPVSELVQVEHDDGLRLRVVSGRRIGSVAYGSSLLGVLLHYPRSVRAARRIEAAIGGLRDTGQLAAWQQDTVTSKLRVRAYLGTLAVNAVLVLGTVVLNVVETAAQH